MVAATPTTGALAPVAAWLLLAAIVGGSIAIARADGLSVAPSHLPKPPEVLAERARDILSETRPGGNTAGRPRILVVGCQADNRIRFTYRESSMFLIPANLFRSSRRTIRAHDPTRMRMVTLEADGTPKYRQPPRLAPCGPGAPADSTVANDLLEHRR